MNHQNYATVLNFITEHPEQWSQQTYTGSSSYGPNRAVCFAGNACRQAEGTIPQFSSNVIRFARGFFDLTPFEASYCFDAFRTLKDLQWVADHRRIPTCKEYLDQHGIPEDCPYAEFMKIRWGLDSFTNDEYQRPLLANLRKVPRSPKPLTWLDKLKKTLHLTRETEAA